jgi:hypothetical protein
MATRFTCENFADIATCMEKLHASISGDINSIHADMKVVTEKIAVLDSSVHYLHEENTTFQNKTLPDLLNKFEEEKNERLKLDIWSRKWNLIIRGVPKATSTVRGNFDSKWEPSEATEKAIRDCFVSSLSMPVPVVAKMLFQAVHRLPSGPEDRRNIMIRLVSLQDRENILHHAYKLKPGSGFGVTIDMPPSVAERRRSLLQERAQMPPDQKKKSKIIYTRDYPFVELQRH